MQTDEKSFFIYYMSKFGGKRDPSLLVEMIIQQRAYSAVSYINHD